MDFNHRMTPTQPQAQRVVPPAPEMGMPPRKSEKKGMWSRARSDGLTLWGRIGTNFLLFVVALLIAAVAWLIYSDKPAPEHGYVDSSKLQAVFLQTGQVYFGNIQSLNSSYLVLTNVFYLQSSSTGGTTTTQQSATTAANQNLSLVKLGCELHAPYDRMIIDTDQITFWENLQSSGQVAKAVTQFKQQNPNGQNCSNTSQSSNSSSANLQNSSTTSSTSSSTTSGNK